MPNRSAGTPYTRRSVWQRPTTVKAAYLVQCSVVQQRPRIDPGAKIDRPKAVKTSRLAVVERNLSQILGEHYQREMNTCMPPWLVLS